MARDRKTTKGNVQESVVEADTDVLHAVSLEYDGAIKTTSAFSATVGDHVVIGSSELIYIIRLLLCIR